MRAKMHRLPKVVECDLKTGDSRATHYVELTDREYQDQIIKPLAEIFYRMIKEDIESGRFNPDNKNNK